MNRKCSLVVGILALVLLAPTVMADLPGYVARPDSSYAYELVDNTVLDGNAVDILRMRSQTWQEIPWEHWLCVVRPPEVTHPDNVLMLIGGGSNADSSPPLGSGQMRAINQVAKQTRSVVAALFQVPNQPLFGGRSEDAIIALTYDRYLRGEGDDWPLLFPMVKSAVRAMDTIQVLGREKYQQDIKGFMLTGGSKRGWTTWLTATVDARVKQIAPFVIDVLNMHPQMQHQLLSYGAYSNQVQDYTELGIQERMSTPNGQRLLKMVDPFAYRSRLTLPKLVVLGTNDPYWTVDAANLYFPELQGEKHIYYQANTGHDVSFDGVATLSEFFNCLQTGKKFPQISWSSEELGHLKVKWTRQDAYAVVWEARSPTRDFRNAGWTRKPLEGQGEATAHYAAPPEGWFAFYVEVRFPGSFGLEFGSCTQMTVLPDTLPFAGRFPAVAGPGAQN